MSCSKVERGRAAGKHRRRKRKLGCILTKTRSSEKNNKRFSPYPACLRDIFLLGGIFSCFENAMETHRAAGD